MGERRFGRRHWILLAVALLATATGLAVSPEALKSRLDAAAADGRADFFTIELLQQLRLSLILAGPCLIAWPFLSRRLARPLGTAAAEEASRRRLPAVETLLAIALVLTGLARITSGPPLTKDTKFYLSESLDVAGAGGPGGLIRGCFTGEYRQDNRHPLYPGLLSLVAERSDRFTDRARLFSLLGALVSLVLLIRLCRRAAGETAGVLGGLLLVTNGAFLEQSVTVACESWWMAFSILWFDHLTRDGQARDRTHRAIAGAAAGLAFLTKGTGALLLIAAVAHALLHRPRRAAGRLLAFLVAFTAVALPLLWRNVAVFGHPFWNVNSSKVMWLDRWSQFHDPAAMAAAGPVHYLASHSWAEAVARLGVGLLKQSVHLLEVLSPVSTTAGVGLPVLLVVVLGVMRDSTSRRRLLGLIFGLFFIAFAWYSHVVSDERFLAALVPLLLAPVAGLRFAAAGIPARGRELRILAGVTAAGMIGLALAGGALGFRLDRHRRGAATEAVHRFLLERVGSDDSAHYLLGPDDELGFDWDRRIRGTRHPIPVDPERLVRLLGSPRGERIRYAIVTEPARGAAGWVRLGPGGGLEVGRPPAGWTLLKRIPEERTSVLIFARR